MSVYICSNSDCDKPKEPSQRFCNGNFCETLTKLGPLNSKSLQKQGFDREIIFKLIRLNESNSLSVIISTRF